jgi:hypothetical protein
MSILFWRNKKRPERTQEDLLLERWGGFCPVCGAVLGAKAQQSPDNGRFLSPPSLKLEVGTPDQMGQFPWRVSIVHGNFRPSVSDTPVFAEDEIDDVYLLCGGGHVFPLSTPVLNSVQGRRHKSDQRVDEWNMVAAVGAPASGKTYLLLRMLSQSLVDRNLDFSGDNRIQQRKLSPLESVPLEMRAAAFERTRNLNEPISPTGTDLLGKPAGIFDVHMPSALEEIRELIRKTVVNGAQRAESWGTKIRQPLVFRTDTNDIRTWTGIADLPGELFSGAAINRREAVKLRTYNALIWVIDPAVATNTPKWLDADGISLDAANAMTTDDDVFQAVLDGSLRPGASAQQGSRVVRGNREAIQTNIGKELTLLDGELVNQDEALELLITITKCDLIRAALQINDLHEMGNEDEVLAGATAYLMLSARRFQEKQQADRASAALLEQIISERRAGQFASAILSFYSNPVNFWNLVHEGPPAQIEIPESFAEQSWRIHVPSINQHLSEALAPGAQHKTLTRDLVMSTVGCGIAFGLVGRDAMLPILPTKSQNIRFFLCSPLATVPVEQKDQMDPNNYLLTPLDKNATFPRASDRSAALTQLLLAALTKARPEVAQS